MDSYQGRRQFYVFAVNAEKEPRWGRPLLVPVNCEKHEFHEGMQGAV
jgi:hypothetical protein